MDDNFKLDESLTFLGGEWVDSVAKYVLQMRIK